MVAVKLKAILLSSDGGFVATNNRRVEPFVILFRKRLKPFIRRSSDGDPEEVMWRRELRSLVMREHSQNKIENESSYGVPDVEKKEI